MTDAPPWLPPYRRCWSYFIGADGDVHACMLPREHRGDHDPRPREAEPQPEPEPEPEPDHRLIISISPGERDTVVRAHCPECEFSLTAVFRPVDALPAVVTAMEEVHGHPAMIERSQP